MVKLTMSSRTFANLGNSRESQFRVKVAGVSRSDWQARVGSHMSDFDGSKPHVYETLDWELSFRYKD
jgi:hypothetical protein